MEKGFTYRGFAVVPMHDHSNSLRWCIFENSPVEFGYQIHETDSPEKARLWIDSFCEDADK